MLAQTLAKPAPCGEFTQQKRVAGMSKPFRSSGHYTLAGDTLVWHTVKPFASTLEVGPNGLYQVSPDGNRQQIASSDNPLFASFAGLLGALIQGDQDVLAQRFTLRQEQGAVVLVPKSKLVAKGISAITITGEPPNSIRLHEPEGETLIQLVPGACQ